MGRPTLELSTATISERSGVPLDDEGRSTLQDEQRAICERWLWVVEKDEGTGEETEGDCMLVK